MNKSVLIIALVGVIILLGCGNQNKTTPQRKNIVDAVFASGNLVTENQYIVTSQSEGYLVSSYVSEGDSVTSGQMLFRIDDNAQKEQLENAEASYNYAKNNATENSPQLQQLNTQKAQIKNKLKNDSINFIRYQKLIQTNAVSKAEYEKAKLSYENAQQDLISIENQLIDVKSSLELEVVRNKANLASQQSNTSFYSLRSNSDGLVLQIQKKNGELVRRGEPLAEIGTGDYVAKLFIAEEDINTIYPGQKVFIELNTDKAKSYEAYISKVYPFFDTQEKSFIAEAKFKQPLQNLKSGVQLQANILLSEKEDALVIPSSYLLSDNYVMSANRKKVKVSTGTKTTEWVEILDGIDDASVIKLPKK
jgi:multidrug resistance efflux pump